MTLGKDTKFTIAFGGVRGPDKWVAPSNAAAGRAFDELIHGAYQIREEIEWLQHLLEERKPKYILEIGVARGGVSRLFCEAAGPGGHVVGLDITDELVSDDVKQLPNYTLVVGDSHDPAVLQRVTRLHDQYDLLLIDGEHSVAGVRQDTEWYLPLVKDGGTVLWHDVRLEPDCGIKTYWYGDLRRKLPGASEFYVDSANNGLGFWRKTPKRMGDLVREANEYLSEGRPEEALASLGLVAEGDPRFPGLWPLWNKAASAAGRGDDAVVALARAILLNPTDREVAEGVSATYEGPSASVLKQALLLSSAEPATAEAALQLAALAKELGLLDTAISAAEKALSVAPRHLEARRRLLEMLTANNRAQRELVDVIISGIQVYGRAESGQNEGFEYLIDWVEHTLIKCFSMQRFGDMIDFVIRLRGESASFVPTCLNVIRRYVSNHRFVHVQAVLKDRIASLPEAAEFVPTT